MERGGVGQQVADIWLGSFRFTSLAERSAGAYLERERRSGRSEAESEAESLCATLIGFY